MKIPKGLQPLLDDGIIDAVLRQLPSGKEASVYVVKCGDDVRCAKVYKNADFRSFQSSSRYREGRKSRGSRDQRAAAKQSRHGREVQEEAWMSAEVAALYRLADAGVRVPRPFGIFDGVLLMELVHDGEGLPAPRLSECALEPEQARQWHDFMISQIVRMLCAGLIHGDLSEYNVLVDAQGPVIIDLPQAVSAAGNNNAQQMLERDVNNMRATFGRAAPELLDTHYAKEMWQRYERSELQPDTALSGHYEESAQPADLAAVLDQIEEARWEAEIRRLGREAAEEN